MFLGGIWKDQATTLPADVAICIRIRGPSGLPPVALVADVGFALLAEPTPEAAVYPPGHRTDRV